MTIFLAFLALENNDTFHLPAKHFIIVSEQISRALRKKLFLWNPARFEHAQAFSGELALSKFKCDF